MRKALLIVAAMLCINSIARADGFTDISSRVAQNPTDVLPWGQLGLDGTDLTTPQFPTIFNIGAASVGNISVSNFARVDNGGAFWLSNFFSGEQLVWNEGSTLPFLMNLGTGFGSVGFNITSQTYGAFTAQVTALDCSAHALYSQVFSGTSTATADGSALFVGIGDTSGANICSVAISTTDVNGFNSFAIDQVTFTDKTFTTPEPSSLVLIGSGLLALVGMKRRKRQV